MSEFSGWIKRSKDQDTLFLLAALLIAGLAALPLWLDSGFLITRGGGDSPFLLQRLHQLVVALLDGHFPVRWMPDANYGFGYPFYNFYAPLSIYVAAAFRLLGFSYVASIQLSQLAGFLAAAWAMFQLVKRWTGSPWAGCAASAAYTLAPFHMANVFVRGDSLAEFWAMAMYPLLILGLDNLITPHDSTKKNRSRGVVLLALAYAGLLLSHNISALIFTPFLILFFIIGTLVKNGWREDVKQKKNATSIQKGGGLEPEASIEEKSSRPPAGALFWSIGAILLGLVLAAWFWLPALAESSSAQLEPVTAGYFHFTSHFRGSDLVQSSFIFDYDVANGKAFSAGLVQSLLTLVGLIILLLSRYGHSKKITPVTRVMPLYISSGLIISTLMITPLSRTLWENLPLLSFTQFPWRFLSVQAFFGAAAVGGIGLLPGRRLIVPLSITLLLISSLAGLKLDFIHINDNDVAAEDLSNFEWFTGNIGSTVSAEYLPESVIPRPFTSSWLNTGDRGKVQVMDGKIGPPILVESKTSLQRWDLDIRSDEAIINLPILYWDGWKAAANGQDIPIRPSPGSGLISVLLPKGHQKLELRLISTPIRLASELVSLVGLFVVASLAFSSIRGWKPGTSSLIIITLLVGAAIMLRLLPENEKVVSDLSWDFDQLPYLNHAEEGILFDDASNLSSYTYSAESVLPGSTVSITLAWEQLNSEEVVVELFSPAINRYPDAPAVSSQTNSLSDAKMRFDITIPPNSPSGPLLPVVTLPGATSLTSSGKTRGDLFLRPLIVTDVPQPSRRIDSPLAVRLEKAELRRADLLDIQLQWLTTSELSPNYNFSLRLVDREGKQLIQFDNQPGYGFQPSSSWPAGMWVDDWLAMPLPPDLKSDVSLAPFSLVARLYDLSTGEEVLVAHLGLLDWHGGELLFDPAVPSAELPGELITASASIDDKIQLLGYLQENKGTSLKLTLYWQAAASGLDNYYRFVHLVDPLTREIILQDDSLPRSNTFPTSQWLLGSIVEDPVILDISLLPSGEYQLYTGFFRRQDEQIVPIDAYDNQGQLLTDGRVLLPESLLIQP